MSASIDPTLRNLNDCGCCAGSSSETPLRVGNRPGLSAVVYRAGTHAQFKETLLARLSGLGLPALEGFTTRSDDDFSITLLDALATVADVLTFYQERIANEAYLRTAVERRSVLELARLIDYQLRPGVAASTYLAFTVEDAPGALGQALSLGTTAQIAPEATPPVSLDPGIKVQSIPAPGEQAQMFETIEQIEARPEWNAIRPRLTIRHPIVREAAELLFAGLATGLKQGDGLILFPDDASEPVLRQVATVTLESDQQRTRVELQDLPVIATISISSIGRVRPGRRPSGSVAVVGSRRGFFESSISADSLEIASPEALFFAGTPGTGSADSAVFTGTGSTTAKYFNATVNASDFNAFSAMEGFFVKDVFANLTALQPPPPSVFAMRTRAGIFGHNAPKWSSLPVILRVGEYAARSGITNSADPPFDFTAGPYSTREQTWAEQNLANYPDPDNQDPVNSTNLYLDSVYSTITKDSFVALKDGANSRVYQVSDAAEISKSDFTLTAKVTQLTLNDRTGFELFRIRGATVFGQSEQLELARVPLTTDVSGTSFELEGWIDGLEPGRNIIVCGERSDALGVRACEVVTIKNVEQVLEVEGFTRITLVAGLAHPYVRDTVIINANVALATHGETVEDVLGGGDATESFQRFTLRQPPLTYTSASNPSGAETSLEVRVNDVLWHEVPSFFGHGPSERIYITRLDDDGKTTVMFGDGKTGARLPTGQENVRAKYRKGIGLAGLVRADQVTLLMSRPLGLKAATNPLASSGAADPEKLDDARQNAPLTILTLDRVVSLQDYEDFARAFSGIEKALATWTWFGQQRGIFLTVAGPEGAAVDQTLRDKLQEAIRGSGDPNVAIEIESYRPRFFRINAGVSLHPDYLPEKVLAEIEQELRDNFSFEARAFGQPVHLSEIMSVIHGVVGVVAVDVNELYRSDEPALPNPRLEAAVPAPGDEAVLAAELLTLDPRPVDLEVLK